MNGSDSGSHYEKRLFYILHGLLKVKRRDREALLSTLWDGEAH